MKAMTITQIGDVDVFEQTEQPVPQLKPGHMIVEVKATSVNPLDTMLRSVDTPWSENLPKILHGDVAGVVVAVDESTSNFKVGDEVYGCAGGIAGINGALAEFMLVDCDLMALKPARLTMKQAAALPLVSITAWEALCEKMNVQSGDNLLVHGATGGVGHIAVQLGKHLGAKVTTTVLSRTEEIARSFNADNVVNVDHTSVEEYVAKHTDGHGFDAIFDTIAGDNIQRSFEAAKFNGQVATILPIADPLQIALKGLSFHSVLMLIPMTQGINRQRHGQILTHIAELVDQGVITPLIDESDFSIWQAAEAHAHFQSGQVIGKMTLENK
ncbi:quinone oxidoreductase [Vibrio sp. T187]|uniref:zinc-dependent alcohol dehydrogenase family protein n=1 Tax=Vibrio TaxID=662 RepID=UPI0010C9D87B|nr:MULTISPECIES: zinc-dependent alcohol dehydrogenase family protein [Vibrio]MBW3695862.1 quinone oxidoreductase [Vibrio sp. T187]